MLPVHDVEVQKDQIETVKTYLNHFQNTVRKSHILQLENQTDLLFLKDFCRKFFL